MTATGSTAFVVEIAALQKLLAEKDAEIERLKALVKDRMYELEEINELKSLLVHAADALDGATKMVRTETEASLINQLRREAE